MIPGGQNMQICLTSMLMNLLSNPLAILVKQEQYSKHSIHEAGIWSLLIYATHLSLKLYLLVVNINWAANKKKLQLSAFSQGDYSSSRSSPLWSPKQNIEKHEVNWLLHSSDPVSGFYESSPR